MKFADVYEVFSTGIQKVQCVCVPMKKRRVMDKDLTTLSPFPEEMIPWGTAVYKLHIPNAIRRLF